MPRHFEWIDEDCEWPKEGCPRSSSCWGFYIGDCPLHDCDPVVLDDLCFRDGPDGEWVKLVRANMGLWEGVEGSGWQRRRDFALLLTEEDKSDAD